MRIIVSDNVYFTGMGTSGVCGIRNKNGVEGVYGIQKRGLSISCV